MDEIQAKQYASERPFIKSAILDKFIRWLVDSGASLTCICDELFSLFTADQIVQLPLPPELTIMAASGHLFEIQGIYVIPIKFKNVTYRHPVVVIRNLAAKAILGADFLVKWNANLDFPSRSITFHKRETRQQSHELFSAESAALPPRSIGWIKCKTSGKGLGYIESEYLSIAASLVQLENAAFKVQVHNNTDETLTLPRNAHVGVFSAVQKGDIEPLGKYRNSLAMTPKNKIGPLKKKTIDEERQISGSEKFVKAVQQLLYEFHDVVSESPKDLGYTDKVMHEIHMKSREPVHIPQFRIPEEHLQMLNKHVDDLLESGCIIRSSSAFNSPMFLVKKPSGNGLRVVQDMRAINEASYDNKYSIKEIQECIDTIGRLKSNTFSTLDLRSGFWQMGLHKNSQDQTAFSIPGRGRYSWLVTPMGLKGSPASFQRLMDTVMQDLTNVQTYIDDCLIHSDSEENHIAHIRGCFMRLREYNLKINLAKCEFGKKEVPYLGHILTADGILPSKDKLKAVRDFPEPQSLRAVREFCGLTNYFRNHIKNFSLLSGQLTSLTRKDAEWKSGPLPAPAKAAFIRLKEQLVTAPMLAYPIPSRPYLLAVDAATGTDDTPGGMGAILSQMDPKDGKEKVVSYASRSLTSFEKNYTPFLLEKQAAVWAIDYFRTYLVGRKFTLFTDHRPVEKMSKLYQKTLNRLQEQMNEYNFVCLYRAGELNGGPDALSRNPVDSLDASLADIKAEQLKDPLIRGIIDLKNGNWKNGTGLDQRAARQEEPNCLLEDGVLHYMLRRRGFADKQVLFVPRAFRYPLIQAAHAQRFAGHAGAFKTITRLQERYYWKGMTADTEKYIAQCTICQKCKTPRGDQLKAPLQPLPIPDLPNQRLHADLIGPLKTSQHGNKMLLVMTDAFTKYAICVAIPNKEAETVAKAIFTHYIAHRSVPKTLVTDGGREFNNKVLDELSVLLGMNRAVTSAYHPQSNSSAESFNRSFYKYMRQALDLGSTLDWEEQIPAFTLCYNTAVHISTLQTPFFLTYLHPPNMPFFDMDVPATKYSESWATERYLNMQNAYRLAKSNNEEASQAMKTAFDKKTKDRKLDIGDTVMVNYNPNIPIPGRKEGIGNPKMQQRWRPDFVVTGQTGPYTYIVRQGQHGRPTTVHMQRLQLQRAGTLVPPVQAPAALPPPQQAAEQVTPPAEPTRAPQAAQPPVIEEAPPPPPQKRRRGRPRKAPAGEQQQQQPSAEPQRTKVSKWMKTATTTQQTGRVTRSMARASLQPIIVKKKKYYIIVSIQDRPEEEQPDVPAWLFFEDTPPDSSPPGGEREEEEDEPDDSSSLTDDVEEVLPEDTTTSGSSGDSAEGEKPDFQTPPTSPLQQQQTAPQARARTPPPPAPPSPPPPQPTPQTRPRPQQQTSGHQGAEAGWQERRTAVQEMQLALQRNVRERREAEQAAAAKPSTSRAQPAAAQARKPPDPPEEEDGMFRRMAKAASAVFTDVVGLGDEVVKEFLPPPPSSDPRDIPAARTRTKSGVQLQKPKKLL